MFVLGSILSYIQVNGQETCNKSAGVHKGILDFNGLLSDHQGLKEG